MPSAPQLTPEDVEALGLGKERQAERKMAAEEAEVMVTRGDENRRCAAGNEFGGGFVFDVVENKQATFLGTDLFEIAKHGGGVGLQF